MPLSIPNTTLADAYTNASTFAGNDIFTWGFFTVANNPAFVQLFEGRRGQAVPQPEVYCPPATYPIAGGARAISGIRARNAVSGLPAQFFGSIFYPNEPGIQAGTPFLGIVAPGGAVSQVALSFFDDPCTLNTAFVAGGADIVGCSRTVTIVGSNARALVTGVCDFNTSGAGWNTGRCQVLVDGVFAFSLAIVSEGAIGGTGTRLAAGGGGVVILSAGTHTIKLSASKDVAAGGLTAGVTVTRMSIALQDA